MKDEIGNIFYKTANEVKLWLIKRLIVNTIDIISTSNSGADVDDKNTEVLMPGAPKSLFDIERYY